MGVEMDYERMNQAPNVVMFTETNRIYSRMALLVASLATFIRSLGYQAIPSLNDTALNIPIAVDAGLGQQGRHGLLITPEFGPRQRLCKVITDMPLQTNKPIDFGVTEFCESCEQCARSCGGQAIQYGTRTTESPTISNNPGVRKWYLNPEKCSEFQSSIGTNCGICIKVCPFNQQPRSGASSSGWSGL
jgi:reductive dehalogenase